MIVPKPEDTRHKTQLFRLLREILKNPFLSNELKFKGGTYAALRGVLDRFSVDLDFDLPNKSKKEEIKSICYGIFEKLDLEIKDQSRNQLQFFLRYHAPTFRRNTLKLEINDEVSPKNTYENIQLRELEMFCGGHTLDTLFANKLVAAKGRFDKNRKIAGRDFYDIHKFFEEGLEVNIAVVEERTKKKYVDYLHDLLSLIETEVNEQILYEDLNPLIPANRLGLIIKNLVPELRIMIEDEMKRA